MRRCVIDYSPLRGEIEFLIKSRVPAPEIAEKYYQLLGAASKDSFAITVRNHIKSKHGPALNKEPVEVKEAPTSFEDYAKKLLSVGMQNEMMNPSKVSHSAVIGAQRTLIEERKVKGMENAQKLMMLKFFRGAIEGEVIDESEGVKSIEANTD